MATKTVMVRLEIRIWSWDS